MYKSIIDFRKDTPKDVLKVLESMADEAFDNHAGKVQNTSLMPYRFVYEGGEEVFGCLELGILKLEKMENFVSFVSAWNWIDEEEPDESCDIIEELQIPIK